MDKIKVNDLFIQLDDNGQATLVCETAEGDYNITPQVTVKEHTVSGMLTTFTRVERKPNTNEEETKE